MNTSTSTRAQIYEQGRKNNMPTHIHKDKFKHNHAYINEHKTNVHTRIHTHTKTKTKHRNIHKKTLYTVIHIKTCTPKNKHTGTRYKEAPVNGNR